MVLSLRLLDSILRATLHGGKLTWDVAPVRSDASALWPDPPGSGTRFHVEALMVDISPLLGNIVAKRILARTRK